MDDVVVISDLLEARLLAAEPGQTVRVAVAVSQSGKCGMFGPPALACAKLAAAEINVGGGLLGHLISINLTRSRPPCPNGYPTRSSQQAADDANELRRRVSRARRQGSG